MICPGCGFEVDEQALTCPYCDAELTATSPLHATSASWCEACGALLNPDEDVCPSCGSACKPRQTPACPAEAPKQDAEKLTVLSSALPVEGEESLPDTHTPAPVGRYIAALCAGVLALAALVLVIWQPWVDRNAKAPHIDPTPSESTPVINALSGQDFHESTATRLGAQGSRSTIEWAHDGYEILTGLAARLKANWGQLDAVSDGSLTQGLDSGRDEAQAISSEILTLYQDVAGAPEDEEYLVEVGRLMNLIEWLETSSKGVVDGWNAAMANDEEARAGAIADALEESGANEASSDFVRHYLEWEPAEH